VTTDQTWQQRREWFFAEVCKRMHEVVDENGVGKVPQFNAPWREPIWILPALYRGGRNDIDLANRMAAYYHEEKNTQYETGYADTSLDATDFNIFRSNMFTHVLHNYHDKLTPEAGAVMIHHAKQVVKFFKGSGQPDYKFHGANDNFPMMATCGLIFAGELLDEPDAVAQGKWNLQQVQKLLSRSGWMSEYNSSTYSPITLSNIARITEHAKDKETRAIALQIEERIWTELALFVHPTTFRQAGPQCRSYTIDLAGHNHTLQALWWLMLGEEACGRDVPTLYFEPDPKDVYHFAGHAFCSIAEYCDMMDADFHMPENARKLATEKTYPVRHAGRTECMGTFDGFSSEIHTTTYMEKQFSVGSVNLPMCGGEQAASPYVTYAITPEPKNYREAASVYAKYLVGDAEFGKMMTSTDGAHESEGFVNHRGWTTNLQKDYTVLSVSTPNLTLAPLTTRTLKLCLVFGAHYHRIDAVKIGDKPVAAGAVGESEAVVPVSVQVGQVYIHVQPLLPTSMQRSCALRFCSNDRYQWLELVNYEGEEKEFTREELSRVLNGYVLTVRAKSDFASFEEFHQQYSKVLVQDYLSQNRRTIYVVRDDVNFDLVMSTNHFGIQTRAINGRTVPTPILESNQIDVMALPFMTGDVPVVKPVFRWDAMAVPPFDNHWVIGSRGTEEDGNYTNCGTGYADGGSLGIVG